MTGESIEMYVQSLIEDIGDIPEPLRKDLTRKWYDKLVEFAEAVEDTADNHYGYKCGC